MVAEHEQFMFVVTHVETDGQFLKIWAQTDERIVQSVVSMLIPLQKKFEYYGSSNILLPNSIVPQTRCCARGLNNEFCRAKILSLCSDGMVLVQFVDFGNIIYVPIQNIRLLDNLPEANYLFSVPDAASAFIVADVTPIGGCWMDDVVKQIRSILVNNKFCGVYKNVNNYKAIKFTILKEDFSQLLIKRNMALYSPLCKNGAQPIIPTPVQPIRSAHQTSHVPQDNWRMPQNIPSVQKVVKSNSFKAIQLEIGSWHDVQISYVEEGPCKFAVQLLDSIPLLNAMMDKINSQSHHPLQEPPIAGTVCLGRQAHNNRLCRVVLNSPGDTSCKVYYVDYGHHEVLTFSNIYQIPDEFVAPNIFSIRFTLSGIMNWNVTPEIKDYFGGIVEGKHLKLRVCKGPMSPLTQYCDLFLNGKSVKDTLSEIFPDLCDFMYSEPKRLQNGTKEIVVVSYVESTAKFFVQLESDLKLLDQVMDQVQQVSKTAAKLTPAQIRTEMPCIALYDADQVWYRASIVNVIDNDKVRVFYVDYGNEEVVPINNLRAIPSQLVKILVKQAIKCSLKGFQSVSTDKELTKIFENLILEERLSLVVLNSLPHTAIVDLYDDENVCGPDRKDITEKLKALEISRKQEMMASSDRQTERRLESSFKPIDMKNQKCDVKTQVPLVQKQKTKNKNTKTRDNWSNNWDKDGNQGQFYKGNNVESSEMSKSKFRKDNENEQQLDNRLRKGTSDHSNGSQDNRFDKEGVKSERFSQNDRFGKSNDFHGPTGSKDYSINDRFNKAGHVGRPGKENQSNKTSINSRLDRSFGDKSGSDKDSDTSSRSSGKRSNRGGRRSNDEQRKRDSQSNSRNRMGRWENDQRDHDNHRKNYNGDAPVNSTRSRLPKDNNASSFDKSKTSDWDTSKSSTCSKETIRYFTSTPISKIPPPNITVGAVKNCIMVFYVDPSDFYVQLCPDNEELNVIMEKIDSIYAKGGKVLQPSEIKEDAQCIAQYSEDNQWYRAVIKSIEASAATVHFIDYGNVETVSFKKIKEIEPEFLKLSAQAIHCKLFCPSKSKWLKEESDKFAGEVEDQLLEAEFITEENGIYDILIKKANQNSTTYINELFVTGIDFIKEKEKIRNKTKTTVRGEISPPPDYAQLDEKWLENTFDPGTKYDVILAWFINPENFYCQLASQQVEFRDMMNEIQAAYAKRSPVSEPFKIGSSVIAVLPDDGVLYRAEIVELDKPRGPVVQYIDYGDRAMVDSRKIYPVEKKFMKLPKQAIFCGLKNIAPASGCNWSNATEMEKYFNVGKLECIFHELKNDKYLISLKHYENDIGSALVDKNLAVFSSITADEINNDIPQDIITKEDIPRIDINLLEGQTLYVKVSNVEGVNKFYIQFHTAETCQTTVDTFMAAKDPQVMPRLLCHEVCIGAGCLVNSRGKWRRSVVINITKTNYEVRFIDTGEHEKVSLNSMLGLPGQVSGMQNQAIECGLFDVPLSSKADDTLKKMVTGKDVKIFVEKIECNRLIVRLFDVNGNKIKVVDTQNTEKISPVCSMQILSSKHDVIVTCIHNSNSIWLQRTSETSTVEQFHQTMFDHYSKTQARVTPEENELYAALSFDGDWYRAKVLKIKNNVVTVVLIDYGNFEDIPIENLRPLESQFYLPHQLAIEVSLTVSLAGSDVSQTKILEPILSDKVFSATFYNVNRKWVAELIDNGETMSEKLASLEVVKETTKTQFEYAELAEMLVGEKYNVIVTHTDSPNQLWLQRSEELNAITELQAQLQNASSLYLDYNGIPEEKSLCLAMYSYDNLWYRAEVLDADDDITTVRFIDYGNTDVINNNMNRLKQLPEKWKAIKKYAIQCKLDVIPAGADDWTEEACARISDLVSTEKLLQALIITDKAPMRIDLFVDNQSVCKILVEEKLAAYIQTSEELEEEIIEEVQLDPRSAFVSNAGTVDEFWVQEEKWINDLEMMEDRLMMASIFPDVPEIKEGLVCIARFPDDNLFYRAVVLSSNEEGTTVRYLDYGNTAMTNDLKTIPQDLAEICPLSRKCCLAKPDGVKEWPHAINEEFIKLAANGRTVFLLDVIEEGETCLVRLTHDSKDVAMELLELCAKITQADEGIAIEDTKDIITEERPSPIGEENSSDINICMISYVNSPSEFWIHKKNDFTDLNNLKKKLHDAENWDKVLEVKEGMILAAKFNEDGLWYRSKVLSHGECGTEVLYIDYGNSAIADSESALRVLPEDLMRIPAFATYCSLKTPEDSENWSKTACEKFIDLIYDERDESTEFRFEILDRNNQSDIEKPVQVALFYNDQNVVDILSNYETTLQNTETTNQEIKGVNDKNLSNDSAIQSEVEQPIVDADVSTSTNFTESSTAIKSLSNSVEILHDSRQLNTEITVLNETVISQTNSEKGKAVNVIQDQLLTEDNSTIVENNGQDNLIDEEKNVVSDSISQNNSNEKVTEFNPTDQYLSPEENTTSDITNTGEVLEDVTTSEIHEHLLNIKTDYIECSKIQNLSQSITASTSISSNESLLTSCNLKAELPIDSNKSMPSIITHEEEISTGSDNIQTTPVNKEQDEVIVDEVKKDIPES